MKSFFFFNENTIYGFMGPCVPSTYCQGPVLLQKAANLGPNTLNPNGGPHVKPEKLRKPPHRFPR